MLSSFNAGQYIGQIGDYGSYNVQTNANELIENHPLFDGLFDREEREELSIDPISVYYQFRHNATGADGGFNLIQNSFGEPLLFNKAFGNGQLLVSSLGYDAGFSNIQLKPIFPPLIYRALIFMSSSQQGGLDEHELGSTLEIEDEQSMASAQFVQGDKKWTAREQQSSSGLRFSGDDQEWESGWIQLKNDARQRSIALLSPMSESIFTVLDKQSWETRISDSPYLSLEELSSEQLVLKYKPLVLDEKFGLGFISWPLFFFYWKPWLAPFILRKNMNEFLAHFFSGLLVVFTLASTLMAGYSLSNKFRLRGVRLHWRAGKLMGYPLFATVFLVLIGILSIVSVFILQDRLHTPVFLGYFWMGSMWFVSSYLSSKHYITDHGIVKNINDPAQTIPWYHIIDYVEHSTEKGIRYMFSYTQANSHKQEQFNQLRIEVPHSQTPAFNKIIALKLHMKLDETEVPTINWKNLQS